MADNGEGAAGVYDPENTQANASQGSDDSGALMASMGLSAFSSILGAFEKPSAIKAQSEYEQTVASTNSSIARLQSAEALETGDFEASKKNLETRGVVGSELARQGASGVDVASGSSALLRTGTESVGAIDELTIRNNAQRQAFGYGIEATEETSKGEFAGLTGKAESTQALLTGGLSAIEGPMAIESNYLRWSRYMGGGGGGSTANPFNVSTS